MHAFDQGLTRTYVDQSMEDTVARLDQALSVLPFAIETMLRIHYLQQWFALSDPAMEEALHDMPVFREFAKLDGAARLPDETTILMFRHLLEKHDLATDMLRVVNDILQAKGLLMRKGTVVDAPPHCRTQLDQECRWGA